MTLAHVCRLLIFCLGSILFFSGPAQGDSKGISHPRGQASPALQETRVNLFVASEQREVALAENEHGIRFVVWSSRRQEAGSYGVFARRLDLAGQGASDEVRVNETVAGNQRRPAVTVASDGTVWIAWESSLGAGDEIFLRRFSQNLEPLGGERRISLGPRPARDPVLAPASAGQVFIAWSEFGGGEGPSILGSLRKASGAEATAPDVLARPPRLLGPSTIEPLPRGRILLVWTEGEAAPGASRVMARRVGRQGRPLGKELLITRGMTSGPVEASAATNAVGGFAVTWLEAKAGVYEVFSQSFSEEGKPWGAPQAVSEGVPGWKSGAAVAMAPDGRFSVSFSSAEGTPERGTLYSRTYTARGESLDEFPQALTGPDSSSFAEVSGSRRSLWTEAGRSFAWTGRGIGDPSGAFVSLMPSRRLEDAEIASRSWLAAPPVSSRAMASAVPDFIPDFVPRPPSASLGAGGDFGFVAVPGAPWTPPDPELAVGPDRILVITNGNISAFDKAGVLQWTDEIENSFGFWGGLGADNLVFDPEVIWDPHDSRFVAMANERSDDGRSFFLLAVSQDMTPDSDADWHKYRIDVTAMAANNIDSPNLAVNRDFVFLTADFFGPDRYLLFILDKTPLLVGGPVSSVDELISGASQQSMGIPTVLSDTSDLYILQAREAAVNNDLVIHAITDPFTSYNRQTISVPVDTYEFPIDPPQMGTSIRPELFEPRIWSVMEVGGSLWAVHHVNATRSRVRWYEIALNGWPGGGTPAVAQTGEIDLGDGIFTFFPSIFADGAGNAAISFARSATNEAISMGRTLRAGTDPLNTFRPVQVVQASPNGTTASRWGDYSGTHWDPETPGRFWGHHEFSDSGGSSWQTWVARYDLRPEPMVLSPGLQVSGATPGATIRFYGTTTGTGLTTVPAMNVTLSLEAAVEIDAVTASAGGVANLSVPVPPGTVFVQAAEDGLTTQWQPFTDILFADGFESGDSSAWNLTVGGP